MRTPSEYEIQRHCAKVYIAEARRRRGQSFAATLIQWAKNAKRRSWEAKRASAPAQLDMFGGG